MANQIITSDLTNFANDTGIGTLTWGGLSNAQTSDDTFAALTSIPITGTGPFTTYYLKGTGLITSLPAWASILVSVTVMVERHTQNTAINDNAICLVKGGTVLTGFNKSAGAAWPLSDAVASYTFNQADLTTLGISLSDINGGGFGCALACVWDDRVTMQDGTPLVDHMFLQIAFSSGGASAGGMEVIPRLCVSTG